MQPSKLFLLACAILAGSAAYADGNRASGILTAAMAQSALGEPVEASMDNTMSDTDMGKIWVSSAHYSSKSGREAGVLIRHAGSKEEAQNAFDGSKKIFKGVDVAGLGDAAYRTAQPAQLAVLKGQNWLLISAGSFKKPEADTQEKLAKELLPKITF